MSTARKKRIQQRPQRENVVQRLPTQIKKGGVEVLATVPVSETTQYEVEMFVKPTFAKENGEGVHWSIGGTLSEGTNPTVDQLLVYSIAVVQPPEIPNQVNEQNMIVWELYRLETEVMTQPKTYSTGVVAGTRNYAGVEGTQFYFWSVGGAPLDVIGCKPRNSIVYPTGVIAPPTGEEFVNEQSQRAKVDRPQYPVECWIPDPSRNDNCRYFGRVLGGNMTPPVITYSNSSTVPLLDENGVGILLLNGKLYVTSADMLGSIAEPSSTTFSDSSSFRQIQSSAGRFFRFHFRQRRVKNPYTINLLYKEVFNKQDIEFRGQTAVTEVTMVQETSSLPTTLSGSMTYGGPSALTQGLKLGAVIQTTTPLLNTQM